MTAARINPDKSASSSNAGVSADGDLTVRDPDSAVDELGLSIDESGLVESGYRPPKLIRRSRDVWAYRDLLRTLVRREVTVRHKNNVLGMAWNLLNPLLYLAIFSLVFTVFLPSGVPRYPLKLLSGIVIYQLFSLGLNSCTNSITANAPLIQKIWFPREIVPIASLGANLVTFGSEFAILCIGLAAFQQPPEWGMLWLIIPAIIITLMLATGFGLMLAAMNVYFRDIEHFVSLGLLAVFWFTPIVYAYDHVGQALIGRYGEGFERLAMVNPLIPVVTTFQRVMYNPSNFSAEEQVHFELLMRPTSWYVENLAISGGIALVFLYIGLRVFARLESGFAERL
ncbi:MAG: ABC transporter permease [Acidimicrobiales bacterium]